MFSKKNESLFILFWKHNWGWMQRKREHIAAGEEYTLWSTGVVIKKDLRRQIGNFYLERVSLMKRQSGSEQGRGLDRWREKQGNQWEKSEEKTKRRGKTETRESRQQEGNIQLIYQLLHQLNQCKIRFIVMSSMRSLITNMDGWDRSTHFMIILSYLRQNQAAYW